MKVLFPVLATIGKMLWANEVKISHFNEHWHVFGIKQGENIISFVTQFIKKSSSKIIDYEKIVFVDNHVCYGFCRTWAKLETGH